MPGSLARLFTHLHADHHQVAVRTWNRSVTYAQLDDAARRVATALLEFGVAAGDRVTTYLANGEPSVVTLLACHHLGAIYVPINRRYRSGELEHIVRDCSPHVVFSDRAGLESLRAIDGGNAHAVLVHDDAPSPARTSDPDLAAKTPWPELLSRDPWEGPWPDESANALMIYTSGTTGASKGVTHTYAGLVHNMDALTSGWGFGPSDRVSLALPLFHVHGLCIGIHGCMLQGAQLLLHESFSPESIIDDFERRGATVFMGVPTMYAKLLEHLSMHPAGVQALANARLFTAGSAALSPELFRQFKALTGHEILERYGMSETLITLSNPLAGPRRVGTVGRPVQGCDIRIVGEQGVATKAHEPGELCVRGPSIMSGYWRAEDATRACFDAQGWFRTGDIAEVDDAGYVKLLGRRSTDLIKSGGYRIAAREIEDVLLEDSAVREVAVVGEPDPMWGQRIVAVVVVTDDAPALPVVETALRDRCKAKLADYKCPRRFSVVDALPRNALGKVQKHRILAELAKLGHAS